MTLLHQPLEPDRPGTPRWGVTAWILLVLVVGTMVPTMVQHSGFYKGLSGGWPYEVRVFVQPAMRMVAVVLGSCLVIGIRPAGLLKALGLSVGWRRFGIAVGFGVVCDLLMLATGIVGGANDELVLRSLPHHTLGAALFEEIFYRAFAFGMLVRVAGWRVWPAAIVTGLAFGLAHLHLSFVQEMTLGGQIGWIGLLAGGGAFYAWLYARWHFNLWIPITLHALMNLWWELFDMNGTALGVGGATGARVLTVAFAVAGTIIIRRRFAALAA